MDIKLYKSPWRAIRLMLLCSIFVLIGIFMLSTDDAPKWAAWLNICFFGMGYPVGVVNLLDRRPQIIINEVGIFDRMAYKDFINWEVIRGAYILDIHRQKFICLIVDEKYVPAIKKGEFQKQLSKEIGAQELNIALGQVKIDETKLAKFVVLMASLSPEQRKREMNEKLLK